MQTSSPGSPVRRGHDHDYDDADHDDHDHDDHEGRDVMLMAVIVGIGGVVSISVTTTRMFLLTRKVMRIQPVTG